LRRPAKSIVSIARFVTHSYRVIEAAIRHGWLPGARYTNLRDVRRFDRLGFLDIDWQNYNFDRHVNAARSTRPILTVARDIDDPRLLDRVIDQASELALYCDHVVIVPKHKNLAESMEHVIPKQFMFGFSVPTKYGATPLAPSLFKRAVHLLGGRPDVQRRLADLMNVVSMDCNRFTLDAAFGDYFDGETFRPHPRGGYQRCIEASVQNINDLWTHYRPQTSLIRKSNATSRQHRQSCRGIPSRPVSRAVRV
jgi:hypothetical protein